MLEKVLIERLIRRPGEPDRSITNTHTRSSSVQEGHRASINPELGVHHPETTCTSVSQTEARDPSWTSHEIETVSVVGFVS